MYTLYSYCDPENNTNIIFEDLLLAIDYMNKKGSTSYHRIQSIDMDEYAISSRYREKITRELGESVVSALNSYSFTSQVNRLQDITE